MKIFLVDIDNKMTSCWERDFKDNSDVEVVNDDIAEFLDTHADVDTIVSAANSFGFMDGGLDKAYVAYFGNSLQEAVLRKIREEHLGEQPVGSSLSLDIPGTIGKRLIHTPTMRVPQPIIDPRVVYTCARSALVTAVKHGAQSVVLPAFGHLTGSVRADIVSDLMHRAYEDVCLRNKGIYVNTWREVYEKCNIDEVLFTIIK